MANPLLLETIKIEKGEVRNLIYHQNRCNYSRQKLFNSTNILDLQNVIQKPPSGLFRCRILYNEKIHSVEYIPYTEKKIQTLKIIPANIDYSFKYANRDTLNTLLSSHNPIDDIIIEKEGYITDTTIANIAFFDGKQWFTPLKPLLEGTMREKLLREGSLKTKEIKKEDLSHYTQVALINAMIGFKILTNITISDQKGYIYDY